MVPIKVELTEYHRQQLNDVLEILFNINSNDLFPFLSGFESKVANFCTNACYANYDKLHDPLKHIGNFMVQPSTVVQQPNDRNIHDFTTSQ